MPAQREASGEEVLSATLNVPLKVVGAGGDYVVLAGRDVRVVAAASLEASCSRGSLNSSACLYFDYTPDMANARCACELPEALPGEEVHVAQASPSRLVLSVGDGSLTVYVVPRAPGAECYEWDEVVEIPDARPRIRYYLERKSH